jgi:uncharacterized membrane protein YidH (DUF202 family)
MVVIALVFSLFVAALGALGLVSPSRILHVVRYFQTPTGLYIAAALRLVMGLALLFAAPASRAPEVLRILGVFIIAAGVVTLFIGLERARRLVDWWSAKGPALVRVQGAFALALGLLLAYALVP